MYVRGARFVSAACVQMTRGAAGAGAAPLHPTKTLLHLFSRRALPQPPPRSNPHCWPDHCAAMLASNAFGLLVARNAAGIGPAATVAVLKRGRSSVSIGVQEMELRDAPPLVAQETRPFTHVPGPKGMPLIGNSWRFLPVVGELKKEKKFETKY